MVRKREFKDLTSAGLKLLRDQSYKMLFTQTKLIGKKLEFWGGAK